ncbi:hypothetical protein [Flagellimonas hymeniacidonis]|nr:hypothetical protein [Flagellimonas hymeniacidonis]
MEVAQHILVYITLTIALGYLVWKFILPKSLLSGKKKTSKACGQDGCGCD